MALFPVQLNLFLDKFLILIECHLHYFLGVLSMFVHKSDAAKEILFFLLTLQFQSFKFSFVAFQRL